MSTRKRGRAARPKEAGAAGGGKRELFDVCVVGTGAGGGVMIQELTAAGFRVVALQRGPFLQKSDFDDDELRTIVRDRVFGGGLVETFRAAGADEVLTGQFSATAACVGGTTARWGGAAWRLRPDELEVRSREGAIEGTSLVDWPISWTDLEPFYAKAETDFGVAGVASADHSGAPRDGDYPNPPHPPRSASWIVARGAKILGLKPFPVPLAINSRPYGGRPVCFYGGNCHGYGCPTDARGSTLSVSIPRALATGRLDLRPNATAFEITVGDDGLAKSVRYFDWKGREQEVFARFVVLAGNAIGSAHLLLLSTSGAFPQGLANSSGLVGRNLMTHLTPKVGFLVEEPALGQVGASGHVAIDDFHEGKARRGFVRGGVIMESNAESDQPLQFLLEGARGAEGIGRGWGKDLKRFLRSFPHGIFLDGVLEDMPVEENRVELDPEVKDAHGLPVPRITRRQHPNDLALHAAFTRACLRIADAAGATERWAVDLPGVTTIDERTPMRGGPHPLGTCRMGKDPERSVLDPWCRAHDVRNLWVVDGSCFPTAGGYPPGLTILANAYRVAARFIDDAKKMNLS